MQRLFGLTVLIAGLALAQTPQDLRSIYDFVRQGLCAANITCAFPREAIFPADYRRDVEPLIQRQGEIILVGTPTDLGDALRTLSRRFADEGQAANWPRLYIVTPKENRAYYRAWESDRYKPFITIVNASSNDSLSALSKFGFPMVMVDSQRVWIPSWWSLDGPTVASVLMVARQTIQILRQGQQREEATK